MHWTASHNFLGCEIKDTPSFKLYVLSPQYRQTAVAEIAPSGDQPDLGVLDLAVAALMTQLARRLDHVIHPPHVRLRMKSAVRVDGKLASELEPSAFHEILHLTALAEPERLDLQQDHIAKAVVDFSEVEVGPFDAGHLKCFGRREGESNRERIGTRRNIIGRIRMALGDARNVNRTL